MSLQLKEHLKYLKHSGHCMYHIALYMILRINSNYFIKHYYPIDLFNGNA
jgi:hypothetical protein